MPWILVDNRSGVPSNGSRARPRTRSRRPFGDEFQTVGHRLIRIQVSAAVTERVWRDIDRPDESTPTQVDMTCGKTPGISRTHRYASAQRLIVCVARMWPSLGLVPGGSEEWCGLGDGPG